VAANACLHLSHLGLENTPTLPLPIYELSVLRIFPTCPFRDPLLASFVNTPSADSYPVSGCMEPCPANSSATWLDNKVHEFIMVKVLHTSLLNTTVVAFKVLPLGSYASVLVPSPPFKTILELVLWNGHQSCRCIAPDVINVIKVPSFQYFLYLWEEKKVNGG